MKKLIFAIAILLVSLVLFTACGGEEAPPEVKWEITLDANGGTMQGTPTIRRVVNDGGTVPRPTDPERQGYEFDGWYVGDTPFDFNAPVTASANVVAKWKPIMFTVTFDTNGGTPCAPIEVAFGEKITAPETSHDYYELIGWYIPSGALWDFENGIVTSNLTLKANWRARTVTVTFNLNYDCANPIQTKTFNAGEVATIPTDASRYGYQIEGWYDENGEKVDLSLPLTESLSVTAKWEIATHSVTFDYGDGTTEVISVTHGDLATFPEEPKKEGYIFIGWYASTYYSYYDYNRTTQPITASATFYAKWLENKPSDTLTYTDNGDYVTVVGYLGSSPFVVIPSEVNGKPVRGIGAAFKNKNVECVYIPASVTSIGESFHDATKLYLVKFEENSELQIIGNDAFKNTKITSFDFESFGKLEVIGPRAFYGTLLKTVVIPESVETVSEQAFYGCKSLTEIRILGTLKDFSTESFALGQASTYSANGYRGTYYIEYNGNPYYLLVAADRSAETVEIHPDVKIIAGYALYGCDKLTSITLVDGITQIGRYAFASCKSLLNVYYNATSVTDYDYNAAIGGDTTPLIFKDSGNHVSGMKITFSANVLHIPLGIFEESNVREVEFISPEGYTSHPLRTVGAYAFRHCTLLKMFHVTENVSKIGTSAFEGCSRLILVINESVHLATEITEGSPYNGYVAYNAVWVVEDATAVSYTVASGFEFISLEGGEAYLIYYSGSESSITLPESFEGKSYTVNRYVLKGNSTVTHVTIPAGVVIGERAFASSSIKTFTLPEGITELPQGIFESTLVEQVVIPASVVKIGDSAFNSCRNLQNVIFEKGGVLEEIGSNAFSYTQIKSLVIPASVKRLGELIHSLNTDGEFSTTFENGSQIEYMSGMPFALFSGTITTDELGGMYVGSEENPYLVFVGFANKGLTSYTFKEGTRAIAAGIESSGFGTITELTLPESVVFVGGYIKSMSKSVYTTLNLASEAQLITILSNSNTSSTISVIDYAETVNVQGAPISSARIAELKEQYRGKNLA